MLRDGDEKYHYPTGEHRWLPPDPNADGADTWFDKVKAHVERHRHEQGGHMPEPRHLRSPRP
jgi:hypothetical protein